MPDRIENRIRSEAIAWHLRLADASAEQWRQFARWLNADVRHNDAYEAVVDYDTFLARAIELEQSEALVANDDYIPATEAADRRTWHWWALAASVLLAVAISLFRFGGSPDRYAVATAPGETKTLALEGGSSITLNGDSSIRLNRQNSRYVELLSGEARFDVRHDRDDPFTVVIGTQSVVDAGTVFILAFEDDRLTLEVAEGMVHYEGYGQARELSMGSALSVGPDGKIMMGEKPTELMASWTRGELVYRGANLLQVSRDLQRATGIAVNVSPVLSEREFSGVIQLEGSHEDLRRRLESVLGVRVTASGDVWTLEL